jgi:hypothetical protein
MRYYGNIIGHDPSPLFNKLGHRCKNPEEINLRNYILFAGDGAGVTSNIPLEDTYPYKVAQELKLDYYNISVELAGMDIVVHNILTWLHHREKPKALVVCSEYSNAISLQGTDKDSFLNLDSKEELANSIWTNGQAAGYYKGRRRLYNNLLNMYVILPVYQIVLKNREKLFSENAQNLFLDGENVDHDKATKFIVERFKMITQRVKP